MLNPLKLISMAKNGIDPDSLAEMLAAAGIECSFTTLPIESASFVPLAESAGAEGARLIELKGTIQGGARVHALLVIQGA